VHRTGFFCNAGKGDTFWQFRRLQRWCKWLGGGGGRVGGNATPVPCSVQSVIVAYSLTPSGGSAGGARLSISCGQNTHWALIEHLLGTDLLGHPDFPNP
jgi:hypothetical protein